MANKVGLTDAKIAGLKAPTAGQIELADGIVPGLRLRMGASGIKTYILRKRVQGKWLNVTIGRHGPSFTLAHARKKARDLLVDVQHQLFNLGGELSIPGFELLKDDGLLQLDNALAHYNAQLPRLQEFILPAGTRAAAQAHVCRTVARRAERAGVALQDSENMRAAPRQYLNRLSDLLFVLSRVLNRVNGGDDVYWKSERLARAAKDEQ